MFLKYFEYQESTTNWNLEKFELNKINLIVGQNASGKTKALNAISDLANSISGRSLAQRVLSRRYVAEFEATNKKFLYELSIANELISKEVVEKESKILLNRDQSTVNTIWAEEVGKNIKFQISDDKLACVYKRDKIQHPFLEDLYLWGEALLHYKFGSSLGKDIDDSVNYIDLETISLKDTHKVAGILAKAFNANKDEFKKIIIKDINSLNYQVEDIETKEFKFDVRITSEGKTEEGLKYILLNVKEKNIEHPIIQWEISQGMFRALSLIIQLNYALQSGEPSCIIIDDIGEGLDYERSVAIIKLIIEKAENSNVQLIMSTNDRFVMNNVPLKYWQVIHREGGNCKMLNYNNSKELFDEFEYTGLNNFDFFTSKFYLEKIEDLKD